MFDLSGITFVKVKPSLVLPDKGRQATDLLMFPDCRPDLPTEGRLDTRGRRRGGQRHTAGRVQDAGRDQTGRGGGKTMRTSLRTNILPTNIFRFAKTMQRV